MDSLWLKNLSSFPILLRLYRRPPYQILSNNLDKSKKIMGGIKDSKGTMCNMYKLVYAGVIRSEASLLFVKQTKSSGSCSKIFELTGQSAAL